MPVTYDNWLDQINTPASERTFYKKKDGAFIHIGQVTAKFIGIPYDEDEYYNHLYDHVHSDGLILLSDSTLNHSLDHFRLESIDKISKFSDEQNLSINRFVALMDQENLLPALDHSLVNRQIRDAAVKMTELYIRTEKGGLKSQEFISVINDVIGWLFYNLNRHLDKANPESAMPAFLWYGNYRKSHQYLLYFLIQLGCDLVTFTPDGNDVLATTGPDRLKTFVHIFPETGNPKPFPMEKSKQTSTVAYRASKDIENHLFHIEQSVIVQGFMIMESEIIV